MGKPARASDSDAWRRPKGMACSPPTRTGANEFYLWFVTDGGVESASSLYRSLVTYGKQIHHILVKNEGVNRSKDWRLIDSDQRLQTLIKQCGVKELVFPEFYGVETSRIIRDNSLGFAEALEKATDLGFGKIDKQRIKRFLRESGEAIESVGIFKCRRVVEVGEGGKVKG